ncbi:MAG TPA: LysM peptidoglycan-binding domain-containing protein [Caldilineaceae bacterium]|nr:LysM peptidoglycan-binding domain-containing protein [Caldilineaceae bacterium]
MHAKRTLVYGVRRRAALLLVLVMLAGALLPTAAFAASSDATRLGAPQYTAGRYQPSNRGYHRDDYDHRNYGKGYGYDSKKHYSRCDTTYRVRKGDNLTWISKRFRVSIHSLMRVNNIKNPNRIYAGQLLCIP